MRKRTKSLNSIGNNHVEEIKQLWEKVRTLTNKNSRIRCALIDAISTYGQKSEIVVTEERVEAWKAALDA